LGYFQCQCPMPTPHFLTLSSERRFGRVFLVEL
jgi:hypothetical protein